MIEIIKRREGEKSEKFQINGEKVQVSYNSWGHLVIRVIQPLIEDAGPGCAINEKDNDTLVVLDKQTSEEVIKFCKECLNLRCKLPF